MNHQWPEDWQFAEELQPQHREPPIDWFVVGFWLTAIPLIVTGEMALIAWAVGAW